MMRRVCLVLGFACLRAVCHEPERRNRPVPLLDMQLNQRVRCQTLYRYIEGAAK